MNEVTLNWTGPELLDVAEVRRPDGDLLALDASGAISCIDLQSMAITPLGTVALLQQPAKDSRPFWITPRWRLQASADGAFAAVFFDAGRHGFVIDLDRFEITMPLDGGDYYEETVPFSICFMHMNGRTVLIHRTAWNRLDASDPRSGRLLTERDTTHHEEGARPPHHLDYFHGELRPNPAGARLFDAGWVWQPVGVPRVFEVAPWLSSNVWESEDGPSVKWLNLRDDWNFPACWIDENRIALGGMGDWDDDEFETAEAPPGVRIVDVGCETKVPDRKLSMSTEPHELFTDGRLLLAAHENSTSAWSLETGECTKVIEDFAATHHHLSGQRLLEVKPHSIRMVDTSTW